MKLYFTILIFIFSFFSCSKKIIYHQDVSDSPFLFMQRTACYGTCPQYTISIYNSGLIKYKGKIFVEKIGCFYSMLSPDIVDSIRSEIKRLRFFDFNNEYNAPMTDVPSVILEVNMSSKTHKVIDRFNGPKELKQLHKVIDSISSRVTIWNICEDSK